MNAMERLQSRIDDGELILIDGGTGTECERRGIPRLEHAWNGGAAVSHPDIVRQIHRDYMAAGAEVIIANTFATHRHVLEAAGVGDDYELHNRQAMELTVEARAAAVAAGDAGAADVVVAAGISNWSWPGVEHPSLDVLRANSADQARILAEAGCELLILEMMIDIERMNATLDGAATAGLPIWIGFTCGVTVDDPRHGDGVVRLRDGEPLIDALKVVADRGIEVVFIMHTDVELIDESLEVAVEHWDGPVGVYAHSGKTIGGSWTYDQVISPADYAAASGRWLDRGARIIGGCCGTEPDHIVALEQLVASRRN